MIHVLLPLLLWSASASVAATPPPGEPLKGVSLRRLDCRYVSGDYVGSLKGDRYESGDVRCAARVRTTRKFEAARVPVSIEISQSAEESDAGDVRESRSEKWLLWPRFDHDVWTELPLPNMNGCMPFDVRVTVAGHAKSITANPDCPD